MSLTPSTRILNCSSCVRKAKWNTQYICSFSTTPQMDRQVRMRRMMFQWLNRVGKNFYYPLKDSTNYLGAYNVNGTLRRVVDRSAIQAQELERIQTTIKENPERVEELQDELEKLTKSHAEQSKVLPSATRRDLTPFPANKDFMSETVLGPWLQHKVWEDVMVRGMTVREVSAQRGIEMSRVAASVRLVQVEKLWKQQGKSTADQYSTAVLEMLPCTGKLALLNWTDQDEKALIEARLEAKLAAEREIKERKAENNRRREESLPLLPLASPSIPDEMDLKNQVVEDRRRNPHESINDLAVLKVTGPQLWHPVSESRHFTRADAAKVFDDKLQPADKRVPHPELTVMHREWLNGKSIEERTLLQIRRLKDEQQKSEQKALRRTLQQESIKKIKNQRGVVFRFQETKVDEIGKNGRGVKGVGCRYGVPNMDRSKGQVKIPQHALFAPRHMPSPRFSNTRGP
ncbi:BgTH12-01868 [Blumeria graminis f. sp. triticale]|uniref:Bgt-4472 n=3 Tax=Blumeria graminis TaxID=34373 RepID=A0A061HH13_BLUGR|nr:hypothetical protein BGT96224_4472 [Blumeria graminis f. sp. tritici 96224]CAD6501618.1 BgTH12-01868 [Blumeria graminis f. sp. triticale]VDB84171.1 Bgt-4472 [Blumeria graminis f. sp. tritici]